MSLIIVDDNPIIIQANDPLDSAEAIEHDHPLEEEGAEEPNHEGIPIDDEPSIGSPQEKDDDLAAEKEPLPLSLPSFELPPPPVLILPTFTIPPPPPAAPPVHASS